MPQIEREYAIVHVKKRDVKSNLYICIIFLHFIWNKLKKIEIEINFCIHLFVHLSNPVGLSLCVWFSVISLCTSLGQHKYDRNVFLIFESPLIRYPPICEKRGLPTIWEYERNYLQLFHSLYHLFFYVEMDMSLTQALLVGLIIFQIQNLKYIEMGTGSMSHVKVCLCVSLSTDSSATTAPTV